MDVDSSCGWFFVFPALAGFVPAIAFGGWDGLVFWAAAAFVLVSIGGAVQSVVRNWKGGVRQSGE